ncbi:type II secretion system F family protein [Flagellimonas sp. CMM7]|uniref:type II secretion system F family protein n=1 Tax=Flagellimonas sp. CMM7 TaxID=2654676 RepID=UPI0013D44B66|nr:type II secretion system F family protein [Flagellimonas sp. CMM7]UII80123.1 type II secretion system F family protein [Flagellimonas sp. CMM7]
MSINISTYQPSASKTLQKKGAGYDFLKMELKKGFSNKNKVEFYKEFATLLNSGVDFRQALDILKNQQKKKAHQQFISNITKQVVRGKSLYEAFKDSGEFSAYEYYSIKIGEETRKLGKVLNELSQFFDRKVKTTRQMVSVFTYPSFVMLLTLGVLYFMLQYVVPMFSSVFRQFGKELPSLTKKVILLSENFTLIVSVFFGVIVVLGVLHFVFKNNESYRSIRSKFVLRVPFLGNLIQKLYVTRFCQSLSLLLSAKTPLITSLDLVQKMISFYPFEASLEKVKADVSKGTLLSTALAKHSIYDFKLISMVSVAEQVNTLDEMFERLAKQYDEETQHQTKMIGVIIEPLIIVVIGSIVGVVLIAMYSPMFDLSKILQN